jgi:hypothetical protein
VTEQNDAAAGTAETDQNDWRVTVSFRAGGDSGKAVRHLSAYQVEGEIEKRLGGRVIVGAAGGDELFLYTRTREAATAARESVASVLGGHGITADYTLERWHPVAEQWEPGDAALPDTPGAVAAERRELDAEETSESLAAGIALFEVRVQLPAHREAVALAATLTSEGYSVVRRWRFLVVGANNADQAEEFAARIRQEAPSDARISIEEVGPGRPYTVFELAAGSGI